MRYYQMDTKSLVLFTILCGLVAGKYDFFTFSSLSPPSLIIPQKHKSKFSFHLSVWLRWFIHRENRLLEYCTGIHPSSITDITDSVRRFVFNLVKA